MRSRLVLVVVALASAVSLVPLDTGQAAAPAAPKRGGRILVTFRDGVRAVDVAAAHRQASGLVNRRFAAIDTDVVSVDDVDAALARYRERGDVVAVEEDSQVYALSAPPDNAYGAQWNLQPLSNANRGTLNWEPVYPAHQGAGVLVAVVDTGFRVGGSDAPAVVRTDIDFDFASTPDDADADDENGHGTHIAGTIAQKTGNASSDSGGGFSVAGVAPAAQILPVKVLDRFGRGELSDTIAGILYAVDRGAKVINLSLGGEYSRALCDAVATASQSALVIAASGNEADERFAPVSYPAACKGAIAIGALRYDGSRAPYSNAGCEVAATAPGGDQSPTGRLFPRPRPDTEDPRNAILQQAWDAGKTTDNGFGFFFESGTSMAAAHAAGAAAVLLALNPDLGNARRALLASARDYGKPGADDEFGSGALDLANAVSTVQAGPAADPQDAIGYWMVATDGGIFSFGNAEFLGSTGAIRLNSPIVGMARTMTGLGYWLVAADGGVFTFGDAKFHGSTGAIKLAKPVVGMAATGTGQGYWLVASDGGIFAFGDAEFHGSAGGFALRAPIVAMATDRSARGYWIAGSDGTVFNFGDARPLGSMGGRRLNAPIVGLTATPTGEGFWLVATDGGIFSFGDAGYFGSTGNIALNKPIVGMTPTCYGDGYWMVANDGGIFAFGTAPFLGSTGNLVLNRPVVGMHVAIDHRASQG